MKLAIKIENKKIEIILKKNRKIVDKVCFPDEHNLTENLLPEIDALIRKNNLRIKDIKKASLVSDIKNSYTTYRIAKSVVNAINWTRTHST